jgi:ribosomal-protein-alanine N-acetyltransferase
LGLPAISKDLLALGSIEDCLLVGDESIERDEETYPGKLTIIPMRSEHASDIADWHYPGFYSFYDLRHYPEDIEEIFDESKWGTNLFSVLDGKGELLGELSFQEEGNELEIGIAMRPDMVGRGMGQTLLQAGMAFARHRFEFDIFRIGVWKLNGRAIRVYERAGFQSEGEFFNDIEGIEYRFIRMTRRKDP